MAEAETNKQEEILKYIYAKIAQAPVFVKERINFNDKPLPSRRTSLRLQEYAKDFIDEKKGANENRIIILPGLRGVGKTTMLLQLYDFLVKKENIKEERVLYFSTDELKGFLGAAISDAINVYIESIIKTTPVYLKDKIFILIDEAHFDTNWSSVAKILYDQSKNIFLVITGSSALNIEISPDLARRSVKEKVFPLSFSEYLLIKHGIEIKEDISRFIRSVILSFSEQDIRKAEEEEFQIIKQSSKIGKSINQEFLSFISLSDLPFSLELDEKVVYDRVLSMIDRIIEKDIFSIQSFKSESEETIKRIIYFLASQSPGGTSDSKLAKHLETSSKQIRNILDILEKTHLIFSIKPYGGAGKVIRKPWKYYFLSPSISTAIRFKLGTYNKNNREMLGALAENMVASCLTRIKETTNLPLGIFYDPGEKGVDFLVKDSKDNIIPIEVGYGKKDTGQVRKAIKKYNSKHGMIVCDCPKIKKEENIIFIPIATFSFI